MTEPIRWLKIIPNVRDTNNVYAGIAYAHTSYDSLGGYRGLECAILTNRGQLHIPKSGTSGIMHATGRDNDECLSQLHISNGNNDIF